MGFSDDYERYAFCLKVDTVIAAQLKPRYNGNHSSLQLIKAHPLLNYSELITRK
jgi:hypothetical protein